MTTQPVFTLKKILKELTIEVAQPQRREMVAAIARARREAERAAGDGGLMSRYQEGVLEAVCEALQLTTLEQIEALGATWAAEREISARGGLS